MIPPYLLLAALLGATFGALFHLWRGKSLRDLFIYLLAGVVGFAIGQALGNLTELNLIPIGQIHLAEASVMSWATLFLAHWLKI